MMSYCVEVVKINTNLRKLQLSVIALLEVAIISTFTS